MGSGRGRKSPIEGVIVLGCHRSGTSAVARILVKAGFSLGAPGQSIGSNRQNRRGFFERRDVRDLNDLLLRSVGCDWDRPAEFCPSRVPEEVMIRFDRDAKAIVEDLRSQGAPFVVKEPRFCLLLSAWKPHFGDNVKYVLVVRDPCEVAWSLRARNLLTRRHSRALWAFYNLRALEGMGGGDLEILNFSALVRGGHSAFPAILREFPELSSGRSVRELSGLETSLLNQWSTWPEFVEDLSDAESYLWASLAEGGPPRFDPKQLHAVTSGLRGLEQVRGDAEDRASHDQVRCVDQVRSTLMLCQQALQRVQGAVNLAPGRPKGR